MATKDPRIDAYIARSADFAKPVLRHLRQLIHKGCPEAQETLKWGHPAFTYKGILCGIAAFNEHCTMGFWKGALIVGNNEGKTREAMGQFGRITSLKDLPTDSLLLGFVRQAARLNAEGIKVSRKPKPASRKKLRIPSILLSALRRNAKARSVFEEFGYSNKKEYVEWITEAKTDETRARRLATALQWMAQGKIRNWKYLRK